jgi:hypothetical protein
LVSPCFLMNLPYTVSFPVPPSCIYDSRIHRPQTVSDTSTKTRKEQTEFSIAFIPVLFFIAVL